VCRVRWVLFASVHEKDTGLGQNYMSATTSIWWSISLKTVTIIVGL